ncbi:TIP41-like protein [Labeo rohita]|uniref:TIP41-like protein n=1 Tax=Labeo rohita TaxID=84645 RepID=A0ABQ8MCY3_LABRO|nr:TIP41-like protein [Labeo rohita]
MSSVISHGFQSSKQDFSFGPWTMLFGDNVLRIQHADGFGIEFNAIDALKRVNNLQDSVKVACAQEWQESRAESEASKEVVKRYDWTYTTDYRGTLLGEHTQMKVTPTAERIDMEKLRAREQIKFFEDVLLFEDELHDHGVSMINVKIRVMPTSFFLLLRFFLRVDGVMIRINDTRLREKTTCFENSALVKVKCQTSSTFLQPFTQTPMKSPSTCRSNSSSARNWSFQRERRTQNQQSDASRAHAKDSNPEPWSVSVKRLGAELPSHRH